MCHLRAFVIRVLDGFAAPALVPIGVAVVAHEAAHIVGAVLCRRPRLAELTHCAATGGRGGEIWKVSPLFRLQKKKFAEKETNDYITHRPREAISLRSHAAGVGDRGYVRTVI